MPRGASRLAYGIWCSRGEWCLAISLQELEVVYESESNPPPKPRATRTPKFDVSPQKSRSIDHLPDWLREHLDKSIFPTLLDYYGSRHDPWTVKTAGSASSGTTSVSVLSAPPDQRPADMVSLLQELIDTLVPRRPQSFKLGRKDPLVRVVSVFNLWHTLLYSILICALLGEAAFDELATRFHGSCPHRCQGGIRHVH